MAVLAFLGFGELGLSLSRELARAGHTVRAWSRPRPERAAAERLAAQMSEAGVEASPSLEDAVGGAAAVLAVVPAGSSADVAADAAPYLEEGSLYADLSAAPPEAKRAAAVRTAGRGARYVDVAVLGTVRVSRAAVPMLASGQGAAAFGALVESAGLRVTAIDAPAGHAALVKLLRSVYTKGRDALVAEMLLASHRYGLEDTVMDSIAGPGEEASFRSLSERVMIALAVHAGRRADELLGSCEVVRAAGIDPLVTDAAAERLRWLADFGLRDAFGGERPSDLGEVIRAVEARSTGPAGS